MRGMSDAANQILGMPARVAVAHPEMFAVDSIWASPAYSTALGLLANSLPLSIASPNRRVMPSKKPAWLKSMTSVFQELF